MKWLIAGAVCNEVDHLTERKREKAWYLLHFAFSGPISAVRASAIRIVLLHSIGPSDLSDALLVSWAFGACKHIVSGFP